LFILLSHPGIFSQDIDYAREIIRKLTSPEFQGRGYVENGDRVSADFIAREFKRMGLLPGNRKSYFQPFNISVNTLPGRLMVKINNMELRPARDYLVESSCPFVEGRFLISKATRGEISSEAALVSLINKAGDSFILIDNTRKEDENPEQGRKIDEYIGFLKYSAQVKARGIIIYTREKLTWESSTFQHIRPVIILNKEMDVSGIQSIDLAIDASILPNYETRNVVGLIRGTSDSDSTLVVLAHYDHLGKMGKDTYFPGANDNASGVALMLNLAKHYAVNRPKYTMVFIALSGEELGLLGAKAFTEDPLIDLSNIKFLVNFDLAGTGDEGIKVVNGSVYKEKFDMLVQINQQHKLLPKIDIRSAACNSDHCLFYQKGVPCFYIYTLGGIQAYHDLDDRFETLPLTEFTDYCKLMVLFFDAL
jgi:hypothetical protein